MPSLPLVNPSAENPGVLKNIFRLSVILLISICCLLFADLSQAKPVPPPQLMALFRDFSAFEAQFKASQWSAALKSVDNISLAFSKLAPLLKKNINADIEGGFASIMAKLRKSVVNKDEESSNTFYIEIQKFIFTLMDNYSYKTSPVVIVIKKYIAEAEEALAQNDFKRVVSEIDEIDGFMHFIELFLSDKHSTVHKSSNGAAPIKKDVEGLQSNIREIRAAAQAKQKQAVKNELRALKNRLDPLSRVVQ